MSTVDPVAEAAKLRRERRTIWRVVRVSGPITILGVAVLIPAGDRLPPAIVNAIATLTVAAFFVTFASFAFLGGNRYRDIVNRFRPGSARAYEKE